MEQQLLKFFDVVAGVPVHPAVVHLFAILAPIVAGVTLWRLARNRRQGWGRLATVAGIAFVGLFVSVLSGEALGSRVGYEEIERLGHDKYAGIALILAFAQFVVLLFLNWWDGKRRRRNTWVRPLAAFLLGVVAALTIVATTYTVYTGERAVWSGEIAHTEFGTETD